MDAVQEGKSWKGSVISCHRQLLVLKLRHTTCVFGIRSRRAWIVLRLVIKAYPTESPVV
jgi:hypothetical protein